jgi:hypothetical protein
LQQTSSPVSPGQEDGEEYVVKRGDWLSKISQQFFGSSSAWRVIVSATNAKAATDPRFTVIEDPDEIEVGQLLWIPSMPSESEAEAEPEMADEEAPDQEAEDQEAEESATAEAETTTPSVQADGATISPSVRFAEPLDGAVVPSTFDVVMAAESLIVESAGEIREGAGHFHILVDTDFVAAGELLPFDENHLHFGRGQLTTTLELEAGVHTLRLQFANGAHIALEGEQYLDTITVTVGSGISAPSDVITSSATSEAAPSSMVTATGAITEESAISGVRFVEPQNGDEVLSPFDVTMEAEGLTVEPAGEIREGAGHLHILVDTDFVPPDELLPFDENHLHFGRGQLTTTLELEPGVHTLNLQFANGAHIALDGEEYRDTITVTVTAE